MAVTTMIVVDRGLVMDVADARKWMASAMDVDRDSAGAVPRHCAVVPVAQIVKVAIVVLDPVGAIANAVVTVNAMAIAMVVAADNLNKLAKSAAFSGRAFFVN